jgi:hypothetical protein
MDGARSICGTVDGWFRGGALDQPLRQAQPCAEQTFPPGHFALIGLMVVAGQVEQSVQDQHLDLGR